MSEDQLDQAPSQDPDVVIQPVTALLAYAWRSDIAYTIAGLDTPIEFIRVVSTTRKEWDAVCVKLQFERASPFLSIDGVERTPREFVAELCGQVGATVTVVMDATATDCVAEFLVKTATPKPPDYTHVP